MTFNHRTRLEQANVMGALSISRFAGGDREAVSCGSASPTPTGERLKARTCDPQSPTLPKTWTKLSQNKLISNEAEVRYLVEIESRRVIVDGTCGEAADFCFKIPSGDLGLGGKGFLSASSSPVIQCSCSTPDRCSVDLFPCSTESVPRLLLAVEYEWPKPRWSATMAPSRLSYRIAPTTPKNLSTISALSTLAIRPAWPLTTIIRPALAQLLHIILYRYGF
jgi:hypothetical protein